MALKRLKKLKLENYFLFSENFPSDICFKLEELDFICNYEFGFSPNLIFLMDNINFFLLTQRDTLVKLSLDRYISHDVMKIILSMPRLKSFALGLRNMHPLEAFEVQECRWAG